MLYHREEGQGEFFGTRTPKVLNPNILLAKLRPGQSVNMELHAIKGRGSTHAKWSPVGARNGSSSVLVMLTRLVCSRYRFLPHPPSYYHPPTHSSRALRQICSLLFSRRHRRRRYRVTKDRSRSRCQARHGVARGPQTSRIRGPRLAQPHPRLLPL